MKKLIALLCLISFVFIAFAQEPVAVTLKVKGDVELMRNNETSAIVTGASLQNSDELESSADSYAALKFVDGSSVVKLFPNSVLVINTEKSNEKLNKRSYLKSGNVWSKVMKKTGTFEIETPTTVVSVKGTEFKVSVEDDGSTQVITFSGEVIMRNKEDNKTASVTAGNKGRSTGSGEISVSETEESDVSPEDEEIIGQSTEYQTLELEMTNADGQTKTVIIKLK